MYEKGIEALERVANVRPLGYRSPGWDRASNRALPPVSEPEVRHDARGSAGVPDSDGNVIGTDA
jgi:hypothetical protein